jgi:hypothetical protein
MLILQRQRIMFSAYRTDQYTDPESYMASLGMVLEAYPNDVICFVTDPKTGIQRRSKWPPTISEIVEACDEQVAYLKRVDRFKNWGKSDALQIEGPRAFRPTLDELKAKYGNNWGLMVGELPMPQKVEAPTWENIIATYRADPSRLTHLLEKNMTDSSAPQSLPNPLERESQA